MDRDDPVTIVREAYRRWIDSGGSDFSGVLDLIAEDVEWDVLGDGRKGLECTGHCSGKAAFLCYLQALMADWEMEHYHLEEVFGAGERVVVIGGCRFRNRATGRSFDTPKVDVFTVKAGKVVAGREMFDTGAMEAAAAG